MVTGGLDRCLHLSGCHYADYLNDPPAFHLPDLPLYGPAKSYLAAERLHCAVCDDLTAAAIGEHGLAVQPDMTIAEASRLVEGGRVPILAVTSAASDAPCALAVLSDAASPGDSRLYRWVPDFRAWIANQGLTAAQQQKTMRFVLTTPDQARVVALGLPLLDPARDAPLLDVYRHTDDWLMTIDLAQARRSGVYIDGGGQQWECSDGHAARLQARRDGRAWSTGGEPFPQ